MIGCPDCKTTYHSDSSGAVRGKTVDFCERHRMRFAVLETEPLERVEIVRPFRGATVPPPPPNDQVREDRPPRRPPKPPPPQSLDPMPSKPILAGYTGNSCSNCSSVRMVRRGTCECCEDCGTTSGCS